MKIVGMGLFFVFALSSNLFVPYHASALSGGFSVEKSPDLGMEYPETSGLSKVDIRFTIARVIRVALGLVGIILVVIIFYAGFLWMTAGGNEEKVGDAKKWIYSSVIGLIIVLSAFAITTFVTSQLSSVVTTPESMPFKPN